MKGIKDRVAIITGTASGIGTGLVRAFLTAGAKVAALDIQPQGDAEAESFGPDCLFLRTDLQNDAEIGAAVHAVADQFGGIDFIVNAAATYADEGAESNRVAWQRGFDTNLIGHVMLVRAALPYLKQSSWPSIVNFTSESAHVGLAGRWIYPATKAAIEQVTRSQAMDLAEFGIRANSVMPGWTRKPWHETAPPDVADHYARLSSRLHMLGRMGTLDEVADAVLFLCSEHAGFVTGSCLHVDGGHSAMGPQGMERHLPTAIRRAAGVGHQSGVDDV